MTNVLIYGGLSVVPLVIGSYFGSIFNLKEKFIGIIAAFGAGAMIAALTMGLMEESFRLGGFDSSIIGFLIGGLIFILGDLILIKIGGRGHKRTYSASAEKQNGWAIILAAIIDGIPESIALGVSLVLSPKIGLLLLVGIFFNNLPESLSSAFDLKKIGKKASDVIKVWLLVTVILFIFVILGYTIFSEISTGASSMIQAIAAGGILAMLASTMMPEAYKESGLNSSLATIFGFITIFIISKLGV